VNEAGHRLYADIMINYLQLQLLQVGGKHAYGRGSSSLAGLAAADLEWKLAETIAGMAPLASLAVKEEIDAAFEMSLKEGVRFERRLFHGLFGSADQKEGMAAFVEKRPGNWTGA
jgi:hypothetical protein